MQARPRQPWNVLAYNYRPYKGQLVERRLFRCESIIFQAPLGNGRHGSIHPQDSRIFSPCRKHKWSVTLPHVPMSHPFVEGLKGDNLKGTEGLRFNQAKPDQKVIPPSPLCHPSVPFI